jgi:hypothetical protein
LFLILPIDSKNNSILADRVSLYSVRSSPSIKHAFTLAWIDYKGGIVVLRLEGNFPFSIGQVNTVDPLNRQRDISDLVKVILGDCDLRTTI